MNGGRIAVLGMGNPVVSDDRVGLAVAEELRRLLAEAPIEGVAVLESTRGGFELIDLLSGFSDAVIIDCLTLPQPSPGRVRRLSLDHVAGSTRLINAHEISITQAFQLAAKMGIAMPDVCRDFRHRGWGYFNNLRGNDAAVAAAVEPLAREIHALDRRQARQDRSPTPLGVGSAPRKNWGKSLTEAGRGFRAARDKPCIVYKKTCLSFNGLLASSSARTSHTQLFVIIAVAGVILCWHSSVGR